MRWKSLRKLSGFSKRFTALSQKQFILEKSGPHFRDQRRKLSQKKPINQVLRREPKMG